MSKEGCPKCIGGVDKDGESDYLDGKNAGLQNEAEVSIRDYRREQPAPPKTRARAKSFAPNVEEQGAFVRADFRSSKRRPSQTRRRRLRSCG